MQVPSFVSFTIMITLKMKKKALNSKNKKYRILKAKGILKVSKSTILWGPVCQSLAFLSFI